jgi:pSer/pThr/pTyr-binding forkhead associated (FHA) protein
MFRKRQKINKVEDRTSVKPSLAVTSIWAPVEENTTPLKVQNLSTSEYSALSPKPEPVISLKAEEIAPVDVVSGAEHEHEPPPPHPSSHQSPSSPHSPRGLPTPPLRHDEEDVCAHAQIVPEEKPQELPPPPISPTLEHHQEQMPEPAPQNVLQTNANVLQTHTIDIQQQASDEQRALPMLSFYHKNNGRLLAVEIDADEITVGRKEYNDYIISDNQKVSSEHLKIFKQTGKYFVQDLNSTNGSRLNGVKLKPDEVVELHADDIITFVGEQILAKEGDG